MKTVKELVDLLPAKEKKTAKALSPWLVAGTLFVLVLTYPAFGLKAKQWMDLQARLESLMPQKQVLERQLAGDSCRARVDCGIGGRRQYRAGSTDPEPLKDRVLWSDVFQQFSLIIPHGVWFDSLEGSSVGEAEIKIRGGAFNYRLISDFMLAMEQSGYFEKPELVYAQKSTLQGRDVVGFEIHCGVKKSQGVP